MFNIVKKSVEWGGKTLEFETGRIARQADGAVLVTYGDTKVLCTATAAKEPKEGIDFFPLTCVYQEKAFAAGKIPGGYFKREGRPTEHETLTSRLIDRPIRPLFTSGFANETQVIATVLQHDKVNSPDIISLIGCAAALAISGLPFDGPLAAARVGYIDGKYILNPEVGTEGSELDIIIAGTKTSVMMVESEAHELSEEVMLGAVEYAHKNIQAVIKLIEELAAEAGKARWNVKKDDNSALYAQVKNLAEKDLRDAYNITSKQERVNKIKASKEAAVVALLDTHGEENLNATVVGGLFKKLEKEIFRGDLVKHGKRIDGRTPDTVRAIVAEVGTLPMTHGSSLFTRGETQALAVATLGTGEDEQRIDSLEGDVKQHFMLHYNFPPYSVGEVGRLGSPGRREIGHGKLAWRAIHPLLPTKEEFPYTLRVVSEVTESNGSSSMATVCATSLALMDAGVPLKNPCAGIAMGLVLEGSDFVVLSDIMGDEDHLGDMDFKVAGTERGITSLQMDIKVQGITTEIMKQALKQAHAGRLHILGKMAEALTGAREEVNDNAPKITSMKIPVDKIREVIGSGGKVIREIVEVSGAKIDIEDDGTIRVAAISAESAQKAIGMINDIVAVAEIGKIYEDCKVIKIVDFGAFVQFMGSQQGLVHVSEIQQGRVENVNDVLNEGDMVKVKVLDIDRQGKVKLSMKTVNQDTGEDLGLEYVPREPKPRGDRDNDRDERPRRRRQG